MAEVQNQMLVAGSVRGTSLSLPCAYPDARTVFLSANTPADVRRIHLATGVRATTATSTKSQGRISPAPHANMPRSGLADRHPALN